MATSIWDKCFQPVKLRGDRLRRRHQPNDRRAALEAVSSAHVADMIRSFDYAAQSVLLGVIHGRVVPPGRIRPEDQATLEPWAWAWYEQVARDFFRAYLEAGTNDGLLPKTERARIDLLELLILEKALSDVDAELEHRPDWVIIPLRSVVRLLATDALDPTFLP